MLKATPQLRAINCTLQNAVAEKGAWWGARWYAGLVLKAQAQPFAPRLQLRNSASLRISAKSIAPCRMHLQKKLCGGLRGAKWGWCLKQLRTTAKAIAACRMHRRKSCVVGCDVFLLIASLSLRNSAFRSLRKINCILQNAVAGKGAWWVARWYASHPQLRKSNCKLQNARVEKGAWWGAGCYEGFARKALSSNCFAIAMQHRIRPSAKSIAFANALAEKGAWWGAM